MIGIWVVSNTAVLKVLEIEHSIEDKVLVQLNDNEPEWVTIEYKPEPSINYLGTDWLFSECMRA